MKKRYLLTILLLIIVQLLIPVYAQQSSNIKVTFLNQDPDPVEPGDYVELRWKVENIGGSAAKNLKFKILLDYPFSLDDPNDAIKDIGTLLPTQNDKDSIILYWKVRVDENAVQGNEEIKLRYYIGDDKTSVLLENYFINIQSRDVVLNVENIKIEPKKVKPGEDFKVSIKLKSLAETTIENLKVKLDLGDNFLTTSSISEKTIDKLKKNEEKKIIFNLIAKPNINIDVHKIPIKIEYSDKFNRIFTTNASFGVLVYEHPKLFLNLEDVKTKDLFVALEKNIVNFIVSSSNIGNGNINYLYIELLPSKDYKILSSKKMYLGNLEPDDFETAEFKIYLNKKGSIPLKFKLRYRDGFNNIQEEEKTLYLTSYSYEDLKKLGITSSKNYTWIIIIIIILIAGIIYYRKRKKNK